MKSQNNEFGKPTGNFQKGAVLEGIRYENICAEALDRYGFRVLSRGYRVEDCGVQIDIIAENRAGIRLMIECKGGAEERDKPPGFRSSDNVRKAIASGTCLHFSDTHNQQPFTPLIVMTPYMMSVDSVLFSQLYVLPSYFIADVVDDRDARALKRWGGMDWYGVQAHCADHGTTGRVILANPHWNIDPGRHWQSRMRNGRFDL